MADAQFGFECAGLSNDVYGDGYEWVGYGLDGDLGFEFVSCGTWDGGCGGGREESWVGFLPVLI
jgi:hypothetical protein